MTGIFLFSYKKGGAILFFGCYTWNANELCCIYYRALVREVKYATIATQFMPSTTQHFIDFVNIFGFVLNLRELLIVLIILVGLLIGLFVVAYQRLRMLWNLHKPILFLNLSNTTRALNIEVGLFKSGGFYGRPTVTTDARDLQSKSKNSVVVICVDNSSERKEFVDAFTQMKNINQPVIIYTFGERGCEILVQETQLLNTHPVHSIATTPLRLVSDLLALVTLK